MRKFLLVIALCLVTHEAGATTITANVGAAGNWTANGSWIGGVAPTAGDDAVIPLATTSITIDAGALCRSANFNTFTGTITMGATGTLTIGDGTAGTGSVALNIPAGATFAPDAASLITFVSTSSTVQTVSVVGYTLGKVTFASASNNGAWAITSNMTLGITATLTLTRGTLHVDGASDNSGLSHAWGLFLSTGSVTRTLNLGNASITMNGASNGHWSTLSGTNITIPTNTATITSTGNNTGINATQNYNGTSLVLSGSGNQRIASNAATGPTPTFANVTRTGTNVKTDSFQFVGNVTISGTLTINGNSTVNRLLVNTGTLGTVYTVSAGTIVSQYTDWRDITAAGAANWNLTLQATNLFGDCGGNTGITFTIATTQTATGGSAHNYSDPTIWTTHAALPQDDAVLSFTAGQTLTFDIPRLAKNISVTTAMNITQSTQNTIYGSLDLTNLNTLTSTSSTTFEGRGASTLKSNGKTFSIVTVATLGGSLTMQDSYAMNSATGTALNVTNGTFIDGGFSGTVTYFASAVVSTRGITLTGTLSLTGSDSIQAIWNVASTGMTFTSTGSTINITNTGSSQKTVTHAGLALNNVTITGGGTGRVLFGGTNLTMNGTLTINSPKSVRFTSATTYTIGNIIAVGTSGNLITFDASTGGSAATLSSVGNRPNNCEYLSITDTNVSQRGVFFYGGHSTLVSGTNWAPGNSGDMFRSF